MEETLEKIDVYHIFYHHGQRFPPNFRLASTGCWIWGTAIVRNCDARVHPYRLGPFRKLTCSCEKTCTAATEFETLEVPEIFFSPRRMVSTCFNTIFVGKTYGMRPRRRAPRRQVPPQIFLLVKISRDLFSVQLSSLAEFFLPSGNLSNNYGKSPFFMGKSTMSMVIFNSYFTNYQRVNRTFWSNLTKVGVSENNVPLNPMVNDHYPY